MARSIIEKHPKLVGGTVGVLTVALLAAPRFYDTTCASPACYIANVVLSVLAMVLGAWIGLRAFEPPRVLGQELFEDGNQDREDSAFNLI